MENKTMENETMEIAISELTEEEIVIASVLPLTYALADRLLEMPETEGAAVTIGANNLPCIDVLTENAACKLSFFPTMDSAADMFVLLMRTGFTVKDETNAILLCENFNNASILGYAVYVGENTVELRAQVPHGGILYNQGFYSHLFEMFLYSLNELQELMEEV